MDKSNGGRDAQRLVDRARIVVQRALHRVEEATRAYEAAKVALLEAEWRLATGVWKSL